MTTNTSFEHIVYNIQDREQIIEKIYGLVSDWINSSHDYSLNLFTNHLEFNYSQFKIVMSRLNLRMISCISDYYSIMDEYTDQFHPKYLSMYASHRNHYNTLTQEDSIFNFQELIEIFIKYCYDFKKFKLHTEIGHLRRAREQSHHVYNNLSAMIASENIYELSDGIAKDLFAIAQKIRASADDLELFATIQDLVSQYENMKLEISVKEEIFDYCECGNVMEIIASSSEMVCDSCGYSTKLIGTVLDDSQFYSQDNGNRYKHAGYEPSKHCKCWLERIQAKETNTISQRQIDKIEACIKRDRITNKRRITISQLRRYLKDIGLTELNEHVALIKKIVTGINPPQLTFAETQDITNAFSKAVKAYNIIRPPHKSNTIYYPFILRKLIEMHVSNYNKQKDLLSFIHLQGSQTLIQNDKIWRDICDVIPGFVYQPTDRYAFLD